jgi:hypothetical protein
VDLGHGISCRGHESRIEELEKMISSTSSLQEKVKGTKTYTPAIYLFMGVAFAGYGLFFSEGSTLLTVLGVGFLAFGLLELFANRNPKL